MSKFPNFLTDSSHRPLGSTTKNVFGQTELRTPQSFVVGCYDPQANVTRDANHMIVGHGDLLGSLVKPSKPSR